MKNLRDYLKHIQANGKLSFTKEEVMAALGITDNALRCAVYKLKKQGDIISPAQNLYVIVPPEYQMLGSLPSEALIPILMKHWNIPYYACLLSAAAIHGASHQKPQVFQVMVEEQIKPLVLGKIKIEFIYKKSLQDLPTISKTVKTGYLTVASPELTAMDLLNYPARCGGLNHTATVLSELLEAMNIKALRSLMQRSKEKTWIQRLGFILEKIGSMDKSHQNKLIQVIKNHLDQAHPAPIALAPNIHRQGIKANPRWAVIENTSIESDL